MVAIKHDWEKLDLRLAITIGVIMFLTISSQSFGKDLSSMYEAAVLEECEESYSSNILWNLKYVIEPVLMKKELAVLQDVIQDEKLEYPRNGEEGEPFGYYAKVEERCIVIPLFSIKFLDDLATAAAWLHVNGNTIETLPEYLAMLKYREANGFLDGRYPTPLEGLHIPEDALENPEVDELARKLLKTAVIYVLGRELGFLYFAAPYLERPGLQAERSDLMLKSDAFAMELMRRIAVLPNNLTFYLTAQTYWTPNRSDFRNEKAYLEYLNNAPEFALFPDRLYHIADLMVRGKEDYARQQDDKLASAMQIEQGAREIFMLAEILESESLQKEIKQTAQSWTIDDLQPVPSEGG